MTVIAAIRITKSLVNQWPDNQGTRRQYFFYELTIIIGEAAE